MYKHIHHPFIHVVFCTETTTVVQAATHMRARMHARTHNIRMLKNSKAHVCKPQSGLVGLIKAINLNSSIISAN